MEASLKVQLHQIADKVENALFGGHVELTQDQINYFRSLFATDSYVYTANLIKYFKQELCIGFSFNILLLCVLVGYIPFSFQLCWNCNSVMTLWLLALGIFNTVLVLPKALLIRRIYQIEEIVDIYMANFSLWNFFRSKVYKFNTLMSRYIFCTYTVGTVLPIVSWSSSEECPSFYRLVVFLLASFVARIVGSFCKFLKNFGNPQQAEDLMQFFNGTSKEEIQSLEVKKYKEYVAVIDRGDIDCSICYEKYEDEDEVRVMNCAGDHAFHKTCIDKWLVKSNRCPQCNLSIFWKTEAEQKHDKQD